ncbi:MAG TPA: IspD/TarI family cytidylyltransferase [Pseudonocardiaceae bacterium]
MAAGVVLASGAGTRVGAELNKVYLPLAGQRVLAWSLDAFAQVSEIGVLVLVIRPQDRELADEVLAARPDRAAVEIVLGGVRRQDSELNALRALAERIHSGDVDSVLIHDAARPLVTPELIRSVLRATRESGAAIPGLPRRDLVPIGATEDVVTGEPETAGEVVTVQTPQGFRAAPLLAAYEKAAEDDFLATDTAACVARFTDVPVRCIPGDERNFKITYRHDLLVAERVLAADRSAILRS